MIGIENFHGALVRRILLLLEQGENIDRYSDWVIKVACDKRSLQSGGTFQNALARKIDEVLIPFFANILSFVDCYYNLDIIHIKTK